MNKVKVTVIKPPNVELDIVQETSIYCPKDEVFFVPDPVGFLASLSSYANKAEYYKNKYDNVLKGLQYWKDRSK